MCSNLGCCVLSSCAYQLNKTISEGSSSLYLYQSDKYNLSWRKCELLCKREHLEMAKIDSSETQTHLVRLLQNVSRGEIKAWIGGRRSSDDTWKYINGTAFSKTGLLSKLIHRFTINKVLFCL